MLLDDFEGEEENADLDIFTPVMSSFPFSAAYFTLCLLILSCSSIFKNENVQLININGSPGFLMLLLALLCPENPYYLPGQVCRARHSVGFPSGCILSCGHRGSSHFSLKFEPILQLGAKTRRALFSGINFHSGNSKPF